MDMPPLSVTSATDRWPHSETALARRVPMFAGDGTSSDSSFSKP
jgi:hypothetical protein